MNSFLLLLKTNILTTFPFLGSKKKKKFSEKVLPFVIILIYLLVFAFITFYLYIFANLFKEANSPTLILVMGVSVTGLMIFVQTLSKANSFLFRSKDYDLLVTLPVSKKAIIASKLVNLYVYNLMFAFLILFGSYFAYSFANSFSIVLAIYTLIITIFMPMIPLALSSFISFLLGYISLPPKVKNILSTILYLLFFILFFIFYMQVMNQSEEELMQQIGYLESVFGKIYPLTPLIAGAMFGNIEKLLIFSASSIIVIALFVIIVARFYVSIHNVVTRNNYKKNYTLKNENIKSSGELKALISKEFKVYFSIPSYVMNTIPGPIISIIGTVYLAIQFTKAQDQILQMIGSEASVDVIICLLGAFILLLMSLSPTTSSSISLEGKNFWILKTSPIQTKNIFISKIVLNALITIPFIIIDIALLGIILKANVFVIIFTIIASSIMTLSTIIFGLYVNILIPKFNYDNPIQVVKQSGSVLVSMLTSFVVEIVYCGIVIICMMLFKTILCVVIPLFISIGLFIIVSAILFTNGIKKYEKLSN